MGWQSTLCRLHPESRFLHSEDMKNNTMSIEWIESEDRQVYKEPAFQLYQELLKVDPKSERFRLLLSHVKPVAFADALSEHFYDEWDASLEDLQLAQEAFEAGECTSKEVQDKQTYHDFIFDLQQEVEDFFQAEYKASGQI
jgi:hypothetical protein